MPKEELTSVMEKLGKKVITLVKAHLSDKSVQPDQETYFRWKVNKFAYTDNGISDYSATGKYINKESWFRANIHLSEESKKTDEYTSALCCLQSLFTKKTSIDQYLDSFTSAVIRHCLNPEEEKRGLGELVSLIIKDLKEEPVISGAQVCLQGIVLQPEELNPFFGVSIRKTRVEDLEKAVPIRCFNDTLSTHHPTAIMHIELLERSPGQIQKQVEKAVTILRLYKIGSVISTSYDIFTESLVGDLFGQLQSGNVEAPLEKCLLTDKDENKLKQFWKHIHNAVPENFFQHRGPSDHLSIAYNRYSEALLVGGLFERQVANAVMGLEALLLKANEKQELTYRLGIRISKLLSQLNYDPYEAKKIVTDAYKVRNLYAHGSQLDYKGRRKFESKYNGIKNLLVPTLNYLRILLVVMLLTRKEKDEFIDLIDDSLIDKQKEVQLKGLLTEATLVVKEV